MNWTLNSQVTLINVAKFSTVTTIKGEKTSFKINNYKPEKTRKMKKIISTIVLAALFSSTFAVTGGIKQRLSEVS